jgi:hypothetical protein
MDLRPDVHGDHAAYLGDFHYGSILMAIQLIYFDIGRWISIFAAKITIEDYLDIVRGDALENFEIGYFFLIHVLNYRCYFDILTDIVMCADFDNFVYTVSH